MSKRQRIAVLVGIGISALFLWFAFRDLQPQAMLDEIGKTDPVLLVTGGGVYFLAVTVIALRWGFLLPAITLKHLFPLVAIGYMGNNVYPLRSGEALRVFLLYRNHRVPVIRGATTVVVERVFDGIVMLSFILLGLLLSGIASTDVQRVVTFAMPLFLVALAVFLLLAARPAALHTLLRWISRWLPDSLAAPIASVGEEIINGLSGLRSPAQLAGAIISSYLTWGIEAGVYWIVAFAFDLDMSYWVMLVVVGTVNLAGLIPASPGQIGVFEFFVSAVLIAAGASETRAASYALVVHVIIWLPVTLVGFAFLAQQGLGWQAITQAHELEEKAHEPTG